MTKKPIKMFALALLAMLLCCSAFACDMSGGNTGGNTGGTDDAEVVKSVKALEEKFTLKIGESVALSDCYEVVPVSGKLSAAQKACTVTSSDEKIAKVDGKKIVAVESGEATITVVSKIDDSKSCEFIIKVGKVFIDRSNSYIDEDDFTNEWDDENDKPGSFRTISKLSNNYYNVKGVESTTWYVETTIKVHSFGTLLNPDGTESQDRWPKIGIVTRDPSNTTNMVTFFMSATIGINDTYDGNGNLVLGADNNTWTEFGFCEVKNGHWAWEQNVTNSDARHHDYCWTSTPITYETEFKLGVARVDGNFHVYINGSYAGSVALDPNLEILCTANGTQIASSVAFYGFSTDATFSNYFATTDASLINAKYVPQAPNFVTPLED